MKTSHVAENKLQRQFKGFEPRKALLTDITYLFYRKGVCYLSPIMDVCTHEALAYELSDNLSKLGKPRRMFLADYGDLYPPMGVAEHRKNMQTLDISPASYNLKGSQEHGGNSSGK